MHHNNTQYSKASTAYGSTAAVTDQRALEGQVLLKAAQKLEDLAKRLQGGEKPSVADIDDTLVYNRKLWQLFLDNMMNPEHALPLEIKNNVASLAVFVFKRTQEILIDTQPEKFAVLININRNIAAGLMKAAAAPATPAQEPAAPPASSGMPTDSMA